MFPFSRKIWHYVLQQFVHDPADLVLDYLDRGIVGILGLSGMVPDQSNVKIIDKNLLHLKRSIKVVPSFSFSLIKKTMLARYIFGEIGDLPHLLHQ